MFSRYTMHFQPGRFQPGKAIPGARAEWPRRSIARPAALNVRLVLSATHELPVCSRPNRAINVMPDVTGAKPRDPAPLRPAGRGSG